MPPTDIYETEDAYILETELPGMTKDDVEIEFVESRLILRGERRPKPEAKEEQYRRRERTYGRFECVFLLPQTIDRDHRRFDRRDLLRSAPFPFGKASLVLLWHANHLHQSVRPRRATSHLQRGCGQYPIRETADSARS
jgi:hypothetical protein